MSPAFERITKKMVRKHVSKDMKPIKHPFSATKFRRLSLFRDRSHFRFLGLYEDDPIDCSLMDILEPNSPVPETVVIGKFPISDTEIKMQKAGVGVNAGAELSVSGEATQFYESSFEIQIMNIPPKNLDVLRNSKLLDPEPSFLTYYRSRGDDLYVVTETIELINPAVLHENSSVKLGGKLSIPWNTYVEGQGQGEGFKATEEKTTLPQGMIMAYNRMKLIIREKVVQLIPADAKEKTFERLTRMGTEIREWVIMKPGKKNWISPQTTLPKRKPT
ncbi:Gasdermin-C [Tupaia chinensis]|uniref:Gasdermin-C n=1 Tax=Tupaia chinensis TaxID=246437 RepID=L9JPV1_TUPCH|nr:Gasdermin-C [Tupaia chinensis]